MDELTPEEEKEPEGKRLVTILYSQHRDLYRVPSMDKPVWLSVTLYYPLPMTHVPPDAIYFGPSRSASGLGWRKAYSTTWRTITPGELVTVPEDDPLVVDYAAFEAK